MRLKAIRCPPASTTQMLTTCLNSRALAMAASTMMSQPSWLSFCDGTVFMSVSSCGIFWRSVAEADGLDDKLALRFQFFHALAPDPFQKSRMVRHIEHPFSKP